MVASGELEPTVALFVRPGVPLPDEERTERGLCPKADPDPEDWQRSYEYDRVAPDLGQMYRSELIPFVEREHGLTFSADPFDHLIMGISSGAVASMAAGFHHCDFFGNVVSHCASYVNIRGAHHLPWAVRNTPRKPLRVFLIVGT